MNFQDVDQRFEQLRHQHDAGSLSDPDFDREREQLKTQDEHGTWWTKGKTGDWFYYNGSMWVAGTPRSGGPSQNTTYGSPPPYVPQQQNNGQNQQYSYAPYSGAQGQQTGNKSGLMIGLGIACAILSIFFLPIVLGPLGIFFGYRAQKEGNESGGRNVMIASGVCGAIGLILAIAVVVASSS